MSEQIYTGTDVEIFTTIFFILGLIVGWFGKSWSSKIWGKLKRKNKSNENS